MPLVRVISGPSFEDTRRIVACLGTLGTGLRFTNVSRYRRNTVHYSVGVSIHPSSDSILNMEARVGGVDSLASVRSTVGGRTVERVSTLRGRARMLIRRAHH